MKTKKVKFIIEETVSQEFEIDVPENADEEEIKERISKGYVEEEFVLEPGNLEFVKAHILNDDGTYNINDDWTEIA